MTDRRYFLLEAIAAPVLLAAPSRAPTTAIVRVSDGKVLECTPDAGTWSLPPGSAVKPFVIAELLRSGKLNARETFLCRGRTTMNGRNFACTHPEGLPPLDPARILAYSCNAGVAHFAGRFTPGELPSALQRAGFRVAASADVLLQALGEDGVWTTPLNLAHAYRVLALSADPVVLEGLEGAVKYGTAQAAALDEIVVAGKTGSATASNGLHAAWFAGFAPSRSPQFVVVVATQGRSGGRDAAPVAAELFRHCLHSSGELYRVRVGASRILTVTPEEYVTAVLAGECGIFAQAEALQAMAIAARTFAAHEKGRRHGGEGFDFCDTTHCQRFQLPAPADTRLHAAANATAGQMVRWNGQLAFTPYTMSCGGSSEAANSVWHIAAPYLHVQPDPFCATKQWNCAFRAADLQKALQNAGLACPRNLRTIAIATRTASGRAHNLTLIGDGQQADIGAGVFRFAVGRTLGWNLIRSDWFEITGNLQLSGRGEGHGVGLCQRGAESMAAKGHSHREILAFYFPGTTTLEWSQLGGETATVYVMNANRDRIALVEAEALIPTLPWRLRTSPVIYVYPDVDSFRSETREPGWVAAHTEGTRVSLQPVAILQQLGILRKTIHHELLHVAIEQHAAQGLPLWFREGLAGYLSGSQTGRTEHPTSPADANVQEIANSSSARTAYAEAVSQVQSLGQRFGHETVLRWVSTGLPDTVRYSNTNAPVTNNR